MNTPIHILLKTTPQEIEMLMDSLYLNWCDEHSSNLAHLQNLIGSQKIYSWFCREYQQKEKEFVDALADVLKATPNLEVQAIRKLYDSYTHRIRFYPKALLSRIKIPKHNIITLGN